MLVAKTSLRLSAQWIVSPPKQQPDYCDVGFVAFILPFPCLSPLNTEMVTSSWTRERSSDEALPDNTFHYFLTRLNTLFINFPRSRIFKSLDFKRLLATLSYRARMEESSSEANQMFSGVWGWSQCFQRSSLMFAELLKDLPNVESGHIQSWSNTLLCLKVQKIKNSTSIQY